MGPTLGIAFSPAGTEGNRAAAAVLMSAFGFGLSLPLLAISYGFSNTIHRKRNWLLALNKIGGRLLGASATIIGALILTRFDKVIQTKI